MIAANGSGRDGVTEEGVGDDETGSADSKDNISMKDPGGVPKSHERL